MSLSRYPHCQLDDSPNFMYEDVDTEFWATTEDDIDDIDDCMIYNSTNETEDWGNELNAR